MCKSANGIIAEHIDLQGLVGGAEPFEAFLKKYLQDFKFKTLTTTEFKDYFCNHFKETQAIQQIDWQTWLYSPGRSCFAHHNETQEPQAACR